MSSERLIRSRLRSHFLGVELPSSRAGIVSWMGAMQAQHYDMAKWAVGLRGGVDETAVDAAIDAGAIVRTWLLRGTLHLVAAADIRWMLGLVGPRVITGSARRYRQLDLDDDTLARSHDVLAEALHGGKRLTRAESFEALEQADISTTGQRGYHMLRHAGLSGLICFGPMQGKAETYVLLGEWTPSAVEAPVENAAAELAVRYFQSHGPATLQDFVWWSGQRVREARGGIADAGERLHEHAIADVTHWTGTEPPCAPEDAPSALLLPAYDEYYLGYRDRSALLDPSFDSRVVSSNGVFRPMIAVNGHIAGIWSKAEKSASIEIVPDLFRDLHDIDQGALSAAADRYANFTGRSIVLKLAA